MFQPSSPQYEHSARLSSTSPMPGHAPTYTGLGYAAELTPADSASVVHDDNHSTVSSHINNTFSFKFNYGNKTHRLRHDSSNFQGLLEVIQQKIMVEHLSISQSYIAVGKENDKLDEDWLTVAYLDDENDQVLMTCDSDLADAVQIARKSGLDRVRLFVHDSLADAVAEQQKLQKKQQQQEELANSSQVMTSVPASQPTTLGHILASTSPVAENRKLEDLTEIAETDEEEAEEEEIASKKKSRALPSSNVSKKRDIAAEYNLPIPQDMLLPAAITFLGVVILGVFTISKLTGGSNTRY